MPVVLPDSYLHERAAIDEYVFRALVSAILLYQA